MVASIRDCARVGAQADAGGIFHANLCFELLVKLILVTQYIHQTRVLGFPGGEGALIHNGADIVGRAFAA
jgi:hypothetical protein